MQRADLCDFSLPYRFQTSFCLLFFWCAFRLMHPISVIASAHCNITYMQAVVNLCALSPRCMCRMPNWNLWLPVAATFSGQCNNATKKTPTNRSVAKNLACETRRATSTKRQVPMLRLLLTVMLSMALAVLVLFVVVVVMVAVLTAAAASISAN